MIGKSTSGSARGVVWARIAVVLGLVCTAALVFSLPALADEDGGRNDGGGLGGLVGSRHYSDSPATRSTDRDFGGTARNDAPDQDDNDDNGPGGDNGRDATDSAPDSKSSDSKSADAKSGDKKSEADLVSGTPCTKTARACVELKTQRAWLIDSAGSVVLGPVKVSSGGPGEETPVGTFKVQWKDKNHKSAESKDPKTGQPAPMPWAVFFHAGGVAFHGGSLQRASAGCVHLDDDDAMGFYNTLKLGDQVQVH
ncbi:MAG TPA: L,D-transpeptidase [Pseudonocardia sp.]|jgi:hypothetical protein|nr:L,D-transpeptidase [Pseudonocardia sp.]